MQYELIEALTPEQMDELEKHLSENIEPSSFIVGSPIDVVKFILRKDLREYKIVKRKTRIHGVV